MAEHVTDGFQLQAKTPAEGLLPKSHGDLTLSELTPTRLTSVAPYRGHEGAVAAALGGWPVAGQVVVIPGGRVAWSGLRQAFVLDADVPDLPGAAVTDQSDAWTMVRLSGPGAIDAMARLCPLDLSQLGHGRCARTLVNHMSALILSAEDGFEILVFRAFAQTLVHELLEAMEHVAARAALEHRLG